MDSEHPTLTVPTELDRGDAFLDLSLCVLSILGTWYLVGSLHWPFLPLVPFLVLASVWMLTGEPATDVVTVPLLGGIASGMRSKLGLRRAHEWVLAWGHYTLVRTWPDVQAWWGSSPSVPMAPPYPRIADA